jgi:hypothetical protein
MNTPIVGRIYHVVDKTTGEVVKVGSTIQSLHRRFQGLDYQKKYTNHFLRLVKEIRSSDEDVYEKKNPYCPFLWHLVAAEHMEICRAKTYKKTKFSNLVSPLAQKFRGLDGVIGGSIGGPLVGGSKRGRAWMSKLGKSISPEERARRARISGLIAVSSGQIYEMQKAGWGKGGLVGGRRNAESGHCARIAHLGGLAGGKIGSAKTNHIRWHQRRGIVSSSCAHCKEDL